MSGNERRILRIHRRTRQLDLIARHNTLEQARFYVERLGGDFDDYLAEATTYQAVLDQAETELKDWGRVQRLERSFLPNYLFGPQDLVVVIGQDGLVANTLKYLNGQRVIAINPDPGRYEGVLLPFESASLVAIVRDVSEFSAAPSRERELLDLNQLIRTTYRLMRYDKRLLKVGCALELDNQLPPVEGNEEQLIQVIMSMLVNAADAVEGVTSRVPVITISTRAEADRLHLAIRDNGCGMDEEAQRHVFDPFYSTKSVDRGTGLGLTLCQSIVTEHGGTIEIESLPDMGTTVHIYLPRTPPETIS